MLESKTYRLKPTKLIPNSPYPLIHYPGYFDSMNKKVDAQKVNKILEGNCWMSQWIFRYGSTQRSHYHSHTHECMAVLSGTAIIRFGVADTDSDMEKNTYGEATELGGIEIEARTGDVFIIPAGVSHKTYNTSPAAEFKLLTPGDGHTITGSNKDKVLENIDLDGFTMIGAYPEGCVWDFAEGGEHTGEFEKIWSIEKPPNDPVMGSTGGICDLW